jgi:hypothetical protein
MAAYRIWLGLLVTGSLGAIPPWGQAPPGNPLSGPPPLTEPGPTAILTAPPGQPAGLPPGSYAGPYCGGVPAGCCGPVGGNGPISYELYVRTGPTLVVGGSVPFGDALNYGWNVTGGGRSLFFNQAGDAAWALDIGVGYTHILGDDETVLNVFPRERFVDQNPGTSTTTPVPSTLRRFQWTTFNYGVGRDWWLNGPGFVGAECSWNSRIGLDVGGRWGTAHVDMYPVQIENAYLRRHGITHSVFVGANWNCEVPMGAWILTGGLRTEWGYTWTNIIPPNDGNIQTVNLLLTFGVRF